MLCHLMDCTIIFVSCLVPAAGPNRDVIFYRKQLEILPVCSALDVRGVLWQGLFFVCAKVKDELMSRTGCRSPPLCWFSKNQHRGGAR